MAKKTGVFKALSPEEKPFIEELEYLTSLTPQQQQQYIADTIQALANALHQIAQAKGPKQLILAQKLGRELEAKQKELITAIIFTIKPEWRQPWINLIKALLTITSTKKPF